MTPLESVPDLCDVPLSVSRVYDSLQGLLEGLSAVRALNLRDVTVTTTYEPSHATDHAYVPPKLRYYLDAKEIGR